MRRLICWLLIATFISWNNPGFAQDLLAGAEMFSHKKTAYVHKIDGTKVEGTIHRIKRKKGLIKAIEVKADGEKLTISPDQINHMYLPPSGLDNLSRTLDEATTIAKWDREEIESSLVMKGYVYFEKTEVLLKDKKYILLMQLLNPGFSSRIKVFHDPFANETTRAGIGGLTVAGGLAKSYYIQRKNQVAYRMRKSQYKRDFKEFYQDCPAILQEFGEKPDWAAFAKHVHAYSKNCP